MMMMMMMMMNIEEPQIISLDVKPTIKIIWPPILDDDKIPYFKKIVNLVKT